MRITEVRVSVFEVANDTALFRLERHSGGWRRHTSGGSTGERHVMHVLTDEGLEGVCTVGDARYTTITFRELEQLRLLVVGEDPLDREGLCARLDYATRMAFTKPGWYGPFDNCLWDIAGKAAGLPVYRLLNAPVSQAPAYYNNRSGGTLEEAVEDAAGAVESGFRAVKDHYSHAPDKNLRWFAATRQAVGPEIDLMHDAAMAPYSYAQAVEIGHALFDLEYRWLEEPFSDRNQPELIRLCRQLRIPVLTGETLMHDHQLLRSWLISGALDLVRANARHGTTPLLALAAEAGRRGTTVELNGPGGLFGLVHVHLVCGIENAGPYEYFPGGSRDEVGREIGLQNPPIPRAGTVSPPGSPGWGAEWDWPFFEKKRVAVL